MIYINLIIYENNDYDGDDQRALFDSTLDEIIMVGDYYHDKICERIDGFISGVEYATGKKPNVSNIKITRTDPMFARLNFYCEY